MNLPKKRRGGSVNAKTRLQKNRVTEFFGRQLGFNAITQDSTALTINARIYSWSSHLPIWPTQ